MIQKWYCIVCDNCGEVMNYWQENSVKDALQRERDDGGSEKKIYSNGKTFCDSECEKEYLANKGNVVKNN